MFLRSSETATEYYCRQITSTVSYDIILISFDGFYYERVGWLLVGWGFWFYYEDWEFDDDDQKNMTGHAGGIRG
jgi:hypothetical protein